MYTKEELALQAAIRLGYDSRKLNVDTRQVMIACRHGHGTKSPCCSISITNNWVNCFSCGEHGKLTKMFYEEFGHSISKELGVDTSEYKENPLYNPLRQPVVISYEETPEINFEFNGSFIKPFEHEATKKYLENRGITQQVAEDFKMKYAVKAYSTLKTDKSDIINFIDRLIIPIYEKTILSIEGRDIYGEEAFQEKMKKLGKENLVYKKCLYPKGSSTNTLFQMSKLDTTKTLYLTEGLMDLAVLRGHSSFGNSTTVFGSAITQRQLFLLNKFVNIIYIHNNDQAGWKSVKKLFEYRKGNLAILTPPKNCGDIGDIIKNGMTIEHCVNLKWLDKSFIPTIDFIDSKIKEFGGKV